MSPDLRDLTDRLAEVIDRNDEALDRSARAIAETGHDGGLLFAAGSGHSLAAVMETFFRAGGLAFVRPLWDPSVLPLAGALVSTAAERQPGVGAGVAQRAGITDEDTVLVFSTSGTNPYPVEIAQQAKSDGATVLAMTSVAASTAAPCRAQHRLFEVADVVLDTDVPAGDVTWPQEHPATAPSSTLLTTALWTSILRRLDALDPELPRWTSANVEGGDEANAELVERFAARLPDL